MFATLRDPKPATAAPPPFQLFCTVCLAARWVGVAACDRAAQDEPDVHDVWPRCCGRPVRCFVFGSRGVSLPN